jgi:hypothetical protein
MAKRNGGIIGPSNVPTGQYGGTASGVWRLRDAFNYIKAGLWPVAGNYPVANSLRFNSGSSDFLNRTPASATNRKTWTYSSWFKRSNLGNGSDYMCLFSAGNIVNDSDFFRLLLTDQDQIYAQDRRSASFVTLLRTEAVYRDVSAWYHVVIAYDTTQATASNRVRLYINGTEITVFGANTYPTQNYDTDVNNNTLHRIGQQALNASGYFFNGYTAETYLIDGQQLTPSSFGQTDSATGIWIPKAYTGTFGTNGFYLKFANSAALGTDSSGNGNTWTANNLTSVDQSTDTPTNNFATMNSLSNTGITMTEGNLKGAGTGDQNFRSTFAVNKGKWYWEVKLGANGGVWGICNENVTQATDRSGVAGVYGIQNAGTTYAYKRDNGTTAESAGFPNPVSGNIMNMAFDADNAKLYIGINGTFYNLSGTTGNPATGSNATYSSIDTTLLWLAFCEFRGATQSCELNFGSPIYAGGSYADGAGYGNFSYAVPSGYYSLNTKNLATYG